MLLRPLKGDRSRDDHATLFRRVTIMALELINQIMQGVLLGGLYALFAIGLSLSVGVMRFVNIAHGDLIVLLRSSCCRCSATLVSAAFWRRCS